MTLLLTTNIEPIALVRLDFVRLDLPAETGTSSICVPRTSEGGDCFTPQSVQRIACVPGTVPIP
jgi:hypothetical protein